MNAGQSDYERAANPQFHETVKTKAVQEHMPAFVKITFGAMALFLVVLVYLIATTGGMPS